MESCHRLLFFDLPRAPQLRVCPRVIVESVPAGNHGGEDPTEIVAAFEGEKAAVASFRFLGPDSSEKGIAIDETCLSVAYFFCAYSGFSSDFRFFS